MIKILLTESTFAKDAREIVKSMFKQIQSGMLQNIKHNNNLFKLLLYDNDEMCNKHWITGVLFIFDKNTKASLKNPDNQVEGYYNPKTKNIGINIAVGELKLEFINQYLTLIYKAIVTVLMHELVHAKQFNQGKTVSGNQLINQEQRFLDIQTNIDEIFNILDYKEQIYLNKLHPDIMNLIKEPIISFIKSLLTREEIEAYSRHYLKYANKNKLDYYDYILGKIKERKTSIFKNLRHNIDSLNIEWEHKSIIYTIYEKIINYLIDKLQNKIFNYIQQHLLNTRNKMSVK